MSWLSSSPSSAIGLGMDLWPILANEIERDVCWGSRKIFSLIGVWYMRRKALFPLSPSFLLVTLSCEIINWTRDHYLAPMKGDIASTSKGGRRKGKQSLGPSCTAEPTPESPPFRLPVRVDNQISFLFKPLLVLKSATCNHTHAMLKTKQTKVTVSSYVPNYLKPRSSFLLGIIPRYTTDISDSTGPQTKLILLLCKPPLCLIPRMHRHPPGHTSQIPGGHPSPPRPSPPISHQSASYVDLTLQSDFSDSIVIVLLGARGSSSFSRATASHGLSLPLVMYLSKPVSTSFQQGPFKGRLWPCHSLVWDPLSLPTCLRQRFSKRGPSFFLHRISLSAV